MKKLVVLFSLMISGCSTFLFYPMQEHVATPAIDGFPTEDVILTTSDNVDLHAWFIPAYDPDLRKPVPAKGTVLFLHGNAENISTHIFGVLWLVPEGYNILALDYRGFGKSGGSTSASGAETDIQTALTYLIEKYPAGNIYVLGQSIGGALALTAVKDYKDQDKISALIIDSSFTSTHKIAREKMGSIILFWPFQYPVSWTIAQINPLNATDDISVPKLFISAQNDPVIPADHTRALYEKSDEPKQLIIPPVKGHLAALAEPDIRISVLDFMEQNAKAPY